MDEVNPSWTVAEFRSVCEQEPAPSEHFYNPALGDEVGRHCQTRCTKSKALKIRQELVDGHKTLAKTDIGYQLWDKGKEGSKSLLEKMQGGKGAKQRRCWRN